MAHIEQAGKFPIGAHSVNRIGYGAMQLAGPGVFGPPKDPEGACALLREAVAAGINHIDTADFYGPHVTNQIIREALHPYASDLVIVTKVGALRGEDGSWNLAYSADELKRQIDANLCNLGVDMLDVVNLRAHGPAEGWIEGPLTILAQLQQEGLIRDIGISAVTAVQIAEARKVVDVACVQNLYNLAHRGDDPIVDALAADGIAYVPFFPLGGLTPLQSDVLSQVAATLDATPMQVALAWLLRRAPNVVLIPGTSSITHLRENIAAADLHLCAETMDALDRMNSPVE